MRQGLTKKFWATLAIFGLMGQVAWVVENMYFNVFIYKMFHASAASISWMVSASAIAATLTTWLMGAFTDRIGKRKVLICFGYIIWGISILSFAFIRMDVLTPLTGSAVTAAALGVNLVIIMDCVMTFFGSTANDAAFNAWLTDCGDETNRGRIEGINSMMPLIAILVVFGAFMAFDLDQVSSWITIYLIIGIAVMAIGVSGFFLIEERFEKSEETNHYWKNVIYCFRPSTFRENKLLYGVVGAFAVFGISIQIFMPYLILYYEKSLGMDNYVMIMAPAIILAAIFTAFYGKLYDRLSFAMSVVPTVLFLMVGYMFLFFGRTTAPVFVGSLFMMIGYLTGMAIFGAMIRDHIPRDKTGLFQGLRIFGQVFVPGIVGPAIGAAVLADAEVITNGDGTTSFLPNEKIFAAAFVAALVLLLVLYLIFLMIRHGHYRLNTNLEQGDWKEYPRPQLCRDSYYSLNGEWKLNHRSITVPFPPQSELSGYGARVGAQLTYRKEFHLPKGFVKDRVILHFGAVDQIADVYVDKQLICHHEGGYLPFEADITEALQLSGEKKEVQQGETSIHELVVKVTDRLSKRYPYGKQCKKRGGMWYTPVSGIWQSVWIESVRETYIKNVRITPLPEDRVRFEVDTEAQSCHMSINLGDFSYEVDMADGLQCTVAMADIRRPDGTGYEPIRWTPENPHLYHVTIQSDGDVVTSYFALRWVDIREIEGHKRICLNGKPIFLHGVLDQGYFCDGIFLPANPSGYEEDIRRMKDLGFNMLRKHIKVEPEEFYYACDRLGMLVIQDMVNSGRYRFIRDTALPTLGKKQRRDTGLLQSRRRRDFFRQHARETIEHLYNHPCIVGYTIFNEGWGQFDSDGVGRELREVDDTRFMDYTSGWFAQKDSDVESLHIYFDTMEIPENRDKPILVSECGGFSNLVPEHFYSRYGSYGYGTCEDREALTDAMLQMYETMIIPAIPKGLCGCVYTQLSDVEDEINGCYTYDRQVCKVDAERMRKLGQRLKEVEQNKQ